MSPNAKSPTPILIVGMARSGTTLVSHVLGSVENVHVEIEPHALWKSGNFKHINDEEFDVTESITTTIRTKLTESLNGKILVEKSPINSLRPQLVNAVFPDAKILYIERDPVRCIYSNYLRSIKKDSFKFSIILKKYFVYTGSADLSGAISNRKLFQQIAITDLPAFIIYSMKMLLLRRRGELPFGPKLKNFAEIVKQKGLLKYHIDVYKASVKYKNTYKELYGENMQVFKMEDIMNDKGQIKRMLDFLNLPYNDEWIDNIVKSFDSERVSESVKEKEIDKAILALIN